MKKYEGNMKKYEESFEIFPYTWAGQGGGSEFFWPRNMKKYKGI